MQTFISIVLGVAIVAFFGYQLYRLAIMIRDKIKAKKSEDNSENK